MQLQSGAPAGAAPQPAGGGGGSPVKWIAAGCGGCFVVFLLLMGLIVTLVMKGTEAPVKEVRGFLEKTTAGDVAGARVHLSSKLQQEMSEADLKSMVEKNPDFFQMADTTFNNRKVEGGSCTLRGTIQSKSGKDQPCEFRLVEEDGAWRISYMSSTPSGD